jgi:hypothetical protein
MFKRQKTFSQQINNYIHKEVNAFLQITDPDLHKEFEEFTNSYRSEMSIFSLVAFLSIATIPTIVWMITFVRVPSTNDNQKALAVGTTAFLIFVATLFYCAYVPLSKTTPASTEIKNQSSNSVDLESHTSQRSVDSSKKNVFLKFIGNHRRELQKLTYILFIVFYSFRLLTRVIHGQCDGSGYASQYDCNPTATVHALPQDSYLSLWIFPPAMALLTREDNFYVKTAGGLIIIGALICAAFYVGIESTAVTIVTYLFGCTIFLYDTEYHQLTLFFMYKHLQQTIQDTEKRADEAHLNELRHMIGNVAHDLKTVSCIIVYILVYIVSNFFFFFFFNYFVASIFVCEWSGFYSFSNR